MTRSERLGVIRRLAREGRHVNEIAIALDMTVSAVRGAAHRAGVVLPRLSQAAYSAQATANRHKRGKLGPVPKKGKRKEELKDEAGLTVKEEKRKASEERRATLIREIEALTGRPRPGLGKLPTKVRSVALPRRHLNFEDTRRGCCLWVGCNAAVRTGKPYCDAHILKSGGLIRASADNE